MAKCDTTPAPEFTIPEDKTFREKMLEKMGYEEIPLSITDVDGKTISVLVTGRRGA